VTVFYDAHGDPLGTPVVLIHAWGESRGSFDRLVPLLPATIRALSFDQRGHSDADKPAHGYALRDFADDVVAFLDALAVPSAVLLGSSSGGYVAQQVAVDSPHRVAGLVLVGSPRSLADARRSRTRWTGSRTPSTDVGERRWVVPALPGYRLVPRTGSRTAFGCQRTCGARHSPD
jgi:rifampin ADP-ribosylating transferase